MHPRHNLLREGGREGGGRRRSSCGVFGRGNEGLRTIVVACTAAASARPRPHHEVTRGQAGPAAAAGLNNTAWPGFEAQQVNIIPVSLSLSPSLSVPQGHLSWGRRPRRPSPMPLTGLPPGETPMEEGRERKAVRGGDGRRPSSLPPPPPPFVLRRVFARGDLNHRLLIVILRSKR